MTPRAQCLGLVTLLLVTVLVIKIEGNSTPSEEYENGTGGVSLSPNSNDTSGVSSSPKLDDENQRITGCRTRPWICNQGRFPPRFLCCQDRCVDVTLDRDNCGLCGIRCRFNWQCCNRLCLNTNINPLNCGACGRTCPIGRFCIFGLCAYDRSLPPPPLFPSPPPQELPPPPPQELPPPPPQELPPSPLYPPLPSPPLPSPPLPSPPLFSPLPSPQPQPQPTEME